MKKLLLALLVLPLLIGCNQKKIEELEARQDSLLTENQLKEESMNDFLDAFMSIQNNLDSIKAKEMIISEQTSGKTELNKDAKDQINEDIISIYQLLQDTKTELESAKKKLGGKNAYIAKLQAAMDELSLQIEEKDAEIAELAVKLEDLNIEVANLSTQVKGLEQENQIKAETIEEQTITIEEQTIALNTAYYLIGTKKNLIEANILDKEGGFIGLGKTLVLKPGFDKSVFTEIDIRELKNIPVKTDKYEIITNHPNTSYQINGEDDSTVLEILDEREFWKSSKFLVIVVK